MLVSQSSVLSIERRLGAIETRVEAARELAVLSLTEPAGAWPCIAKWADHSDGETRSVIAAAVASILDTHFDTVVPHVADAAAANARVGNTILPPCFPVCRGPRYKVLQQHLRRALAAQPGTTADETPSIDAILDMDVDEFADELLEFLLCRDDPSESEKLALNLLMLGVEEANGGLLQYYHNSAGNEARNLPKALLAVGATGHAHVVAEMNALFGAQGPSRNTDGRRRQLATMCEAPDERCRKLEKAFARQRTDYIAKLQDFVRAHRERFGAA